MENNDYYEPTIKTARTTTSNTNYYQLDYANELTKLNVEKQRLISFLEEKIKGYNDEIQHCREVKKEYPKVKEDIRDFYIERDIYQEVLDFFNKGGKEWK